MDTGTKGRGVFKNDASEFVYVRTYSRWIPELCRRETWEMTVDRYIEFITKNRPNIPAKVIRKIRNYMMSFDVMPSMRALWAAGPAAEADNTTLYNCSFQIIDSIEAFSECLYILMCGTGYGFRVSAKYDVNKLPDVPVITSQGMGTFIIEDSKVGWADSVKNLLVALYQGKDLDMDYSKIRPKGARLKTMGGRASGPAPLINLHSFIRSTFSQAQGRKLTSLEAHDILNEVASIVVVGGVRRSSEISLSDLDDAIMRNAKSGSFPVRRYMANNSAVYYEKPTAVQFLQEWSALAASGTGERGIFNLDGAKKASPKRRDVSKIGGTNPCGEILLRSKEFCNLSEVVVRESDDLVDLLDKVETATWLGVIQATFTHFPYLSPEWKANCEEERLLGVSVTGQMDNPKLLSADALKAMKSKAIKVAKSASQKMGINMPAAITCVKPSGTVSQLVDCASGLHPRYSQYYIRRYRISSTDSLCKMMKAQGIIMSPENGQRKSDWDKAVEILKDKNIQDSYNVCPIFREGEEWSEDKVLTWVVSFPVKAPETAVFRDQVTAIQQLEHYKKIQENWCEHNASATIYVKDSEWLEVGNWVYANWEIINGVSFLPYDGGQYEQAPYQEITKEQYEKMLKTFKAPDYDDLGIYELEDETQGSQELACVGDKCELK